jgi:hypothetical protein
MAPNAAAAGLSALSWAQGAFLVEPWVLICMRRCQRGTLDIEYDAAQFVVSVRRRTYPPGVCTSSKLYSCPGQ